MAKNTRGYLQSILQPRVALGVALTLFSFGTVAGQAKWPAVCLWDAAQVTFAHMTDRARQYGDAIRFVYTLEHQLKDLEQQETQERRPQPAPRHHC
ncbi:MAG TPA: hypothetical protein VFB14_15830 [Bryobacteraceae bacterium]|nr:hypothetical protein [Bryobacteraceae bacterium]